MMMETCGPLPLRWEPECLHLSFRFPLLRTAHSHPSAALCMESTWTAQSISETEAGSSAPGAVRMVWAPAQLWSSLNCCSRPRVSRVVISTWHSRENAQQVSQEEDTFFFLSTIFRLCVCTLRDKELERKTQVTHREKWVPESNEESQWKPQSSFTQNQQGNNSSGSILKDGFFFLGPF